MSDTATLLHSVRRDHLNSVLRVGLKAASSFDDLGLELRRDVVYCWLRREHDKMWGGQGEFAYVEVEVRVRRCRVAEMDFASIALMYLQGRGGRPVNREAAHLLAKPYEVPSCPLEDYRDGVFSSPEVLVKGDISPKDIRATT